MNLKTDIGIYSITHVESGKRYIGSTYCNFYDRFCAHRSTLRRKCHSSILLQRAWDKYGINAFKFEILEIVSQKLDERELHYINLYKSSDPQFGYNISKETNNARLGHQQSTESKEKISKKLKGIKRSSETIKKISESRLGENNPSFGKKQTKETIAKRIKNNYVPLLREDGKKFSSLKEAARDLNCLPQAISQSLRKGYRAKGYRFFYIKAEI
jgi:group I intron endonuclease